MSAGKEFVGRVKWFNAEKGYGFITVEGFKQDVFLHIKQLRTSGVTRNPADGETVRFVMNEGPKGSFASNVSLG